VVKSIFVSIIVICLCHCLCTAQTKEAFHLRVGAAKIDITPKDQPIAPATGKYDHERTYVRAIVLDNGVTRAALISMDGNIWDTNYTKDFNQLAIELNCPIENIVFSCTHSHSAKYFLGVGATPGDTSTQALIRSVTSAVHQAKAKLQPARMGFGKGTSFLNVNRNVIDYDTRKWTQAANIDGFSDKSVDVIKFETPDGEPIAVYVNYAMHPVNGFVSGVHSADFPGAACRYVEKAFGDKIIVAFCQGAEGDQNPLYLRPSTNMMASRVGSKISGYELKREPIEAQLRGNSDFPLASASELDNMFKMMESEGQILGEEIIRVMTVTRKTTGNVRIAGSQKTITCPGRIRINYVAADPFYREGIPGEYKDGPDVNIHLGVLGIGTTAIAFSDGEFFSYIGQLMKKESPLTNTMVVSLANGGGGPGYVPDDAAYVQQTFQVINTNLKEGCAEKGIVNAMVDMVNNYLTK
jgi:neutral ceramidase